MRSDDARERMIKRMLKLDGSEYARMDFEGEWNEGDHPRAKNGTFTTKGQGETGNAPVKEVKTEKKPVSAPRIGKGHANKAERAASGKAAFKIESTKESPAVKEVASKYEGKTGANISDSHAELFSLALMEQAKATGASQSDIDGYISKKIGGQTDLLGRRKMAATIEFLKKKNGMTEVQISKATGIPESVVNYYNQSLAVEGARDIHAKIREHNMAIAELKGLDIVKQQQQIIRNQKADGVNTWTDNTPERKKKRDEAVEEILSRGSLTKGKKRTGEVKKGNRVDIVIGPPAAGKSSVIVNRLSQALGSRILDSDEIKELLPGYEEEGGANKVHIESNNILKQMILPKFLDKNSEYYGDNLIIPIVGWNDKKPLQFLKQLSDAGYEVHLSLNTLPIEASANRMISRYIETGRYIDLNYLENDVGNNPEKTYEEFKKMKCFKSYTEFSNDVAYGEKPILLDCTDQDGNGREPEDYLVYQRKKS